MMREPDRMKRGPGRLVILFNGLRDFVIGDRVIVGPGLLESQTIRGRQVRVIPSVLAMAKAFEEQNSNAQGGTDANGNPLPQNPFGSGAGTGLPGVTMDDEGNFYDPSGNLLDWRQIHVCVSDGAGGWTPMTLGVFASLYLS